MRCPSSSSSTDAARELCSGGTPAAAASAASAQQHHSITAAASSHVVVTRYNEATRDDDGDDDEATEGQVKREKMAATITGMAASGCGNMAITMVLAQHHGSDTYGPTRALIYIWQIYWQIKLYIHQIKIRAELGGR